MNKKKNYKSREEKFFLEYLHKDIFYSLSENERRFYREYRRYHRFLHEGNQRISQLKSEIEIRKNRISEIKSKINGVDGNSGWTEKMKLNFEKIQHRFSDFNFSVSVGFRDRKKEIQKNIQDYKSGKKGRKRDLRNQTHYNGKKILEKNLKMYVRVTRTKDLYRNIYVGGEEDIRKFLSEIFSEDWSNDPIEFVRDEMRKVYESYTRHYVFHNDWNKFLNKESSHNLKELKDWYEKIGDERYDW